MKKQDDLNIDGINIILIIVVIILFIAGIFSLKIGLERQEKYECNKWAEQAKEYPYFYYTDWQIEQCFR
jgi:hypothetical protein